MGRVCTVLEALGFFLTNNSYANTPRLALRVLFSGPLLHTWVYVGPNLKQAVLMSRLSNRLFVTGSSISHGGLERDM